MRLTIFGSLCVIAIISFCFNLIYGTYTIISLSSQKKKLEDLYVQLQEESENLKIDIEKLNDDNYLANYARENYLYSKDGEYILQIDDIEKIEEDMSKEINKNYIILGLSILMVLIFIYILSKGKKKKRKK